MSCRVPSAGVGLPSGRPPPRAGCRSRRPASCAGELRALDRRGRRRPGGQRRRLVAGLPRRVRGLRRSLQDGELSGPLLRCLSCGADFDLPRAGRPRPGGAAQLTPVPLLASGRSPGGGVSRLDEGGRAPAGRDAARMRSIAQAGALAREQQPGRLAFAAPPDGCDICHAPMPATTATCCSSRSAGSCARASRAGRSIPGTPRYRPPGTRTVRLDGFGLDDELWARSRSRSAWRSSCAPRSPAASWRFIPVRPGRPNPSSPRGLGQLVAANPSLNDLDPDAEALIVNRLRGRRSTSIAPIDKCYALVGPDQIALGGDLRWRSGRRSGPGVLRGAARARGARPGVRS